MTRTRLTSGAGMLAGALLVFLACQAERLESAGNLVGGGIDTVLVVPAQLFARVGESRRVVAYVARTAQHDTVVVPVTWHSTDEAVATVAANGSVLAVGAGSASIVASVDGHDGIATLVVQPVAATQVRMNPTTLTLQPGGTGSIAAQALDGSGSVIPGRTFTWQSSNTAVATVSQTGQVTGVAVGTATVTASVDGIFGSVAVTVGSPPVTSASVTVTPPSVSLRTGLTQQLSATVRDASGNIITRAVSWQTSNPAVAGVSINGLVTAVAPGTAVVTATADGITGQATVSVSPAVAATVTVSPATAQAFVGGTVQFTAVARDAGGQVIGGAVPTWSSSNLAVASVNGSGLVTGNAAGSATITARVDGIGGNAQVNVATLSGGTTEPAAPATLVFGDDFDNATSAGQGYATRGNMSLVTGRGGAGRAIRFPYTPASADNLIERGITPSTNFYFQYWYRASAGTDFTCGGRNPSGIKWLMLWRANGPRYTNGVGDLDNGGPGAPQTFLEFTTHDNSSLRQPNPFLQNISKTPKFGTTNDGQWHRYTIHVVSGNGGYEQIWIDGTLVLDNRAQAYDHSAEGISMFQLPGLMVAGVSTGCDFTLDIDDIKIWSAP